MRLQGDRDTGGERYQATSQVTPVTAMALLRRACHFETDGFNSRPA